MNNLLQHVIMAAAASGLLAQTNGVPNSVEVESGTAAFEVSTNMPGIEVKGKSTALTAHLELSRDGNGLTLQQIEATVPVKSLSTGMKVRDEHMRKFIFTTSTGEEPDLHFSASKAVCSAKTGHDFACQIPGAMNIRGVSHPLEMSLAVKEQGGSSKAYRAIGNSIVKLSDYNIEAPSQFGVKPSNEVKVHLEFTGKLNTSMASSGGGAQ